MAKVDIVQEGKAAGIWISGPKGSIALVNEDSKGPYLIMHGPNYDTVPLAISIDQEKPNKANFQLPDKNGRLNRDVKIVSIKALVDLLSKDDAHHEGHCCHCHHEQARQQNSQPKAD